MIRIVSGCFLMLVGVGGILDAWLNPGAFRDSFATNLLTFAIGLVVPGMFFFYFGRRARLRRKTGDQGKMRLADQSRWSLIRQAPPAKELLNQNDKTANETANAQYPGQKNANVLLREIVSKPVVTLEQDSEKKKQISQIVRLGPSVIPAIKSIIENEIKPGTGSSTFENAGLLCEAIGKIGGPDAADVLSRFATQESNMAEYRHIRAGAKKGLSLLGQGMQKTGTGEGEPEIKIRAGEPEKKRTRADIPPLLDAAQDKAKSGECLAAVEFFLQAVEIDPVFMMDSLAWQHLASVFTGVQPPVWGKNWVRIPKELIPENVLSRLSRLPVPSKPAGYTGTHVEPPGEAEIIGLIADLRSILNNSKEITSETVRIKRAYKSSNDADMGNVLIATAYEAMGQAPPEGARGLERIKDLEAGHTTLENESVQTGSIANEKKKNKLMALVNQALLEEKESLKIIVAETGAEAGIISSLLTKVHHVPKGEITEIGPTCSDSLIDQLLALTRAIAIVPKDIINNRPCLFRPPPGSHHAVALQWLDGEVCRFPMRVQGSTVQFPSNWFA
jgi:hypothetical protein